MGHHAKSPPCGPNQRASGVLARELGEEEELHRAATPPCHCSKTISAQRRDERLNTLQPHYGMQPKRTQPSLTSRGRWHWTAGHSCAAAHRERPYAPVGRHVRKARQRAVDLELRAAHHVGVSGLNLVQVHQGRCIHTKASTI